ncbi:Uncharacterized protein dnm_008940 [Desulfonema magnum]|uniref:Uncharacterized protein n=1 Tax=Desulfonema magnum TaxID=45655 RepID=A0A975BGD8_9BACT|nr:Uncharacterized protein dnm_008940 [Desulfonema magnum]
MFCGSCQIKLFVDFYLLRLFTGKKVLQKLQGNRIRKGKEFSIVTDCPTPD